MMNIGQDLLNEGQKSTYTVIVVGSNITRFGSSFLLSQDNPKSFRKFVTNCHVLDAALAYSATCSGELRVANRVNSYLINDKESDKGLDLALLVHDASPKELEEIGFEIEITSVGIGEMVHTWGFPDPYPSLVPLLGVGYISGFQNETQQYYLNMAVNPGNSGGPLVAKSEEGVKVIAVIVNKLIYTKTEILKKLNDLRTLSGLLQMNVGATTTDLASTLAEAFEFTTNASQLVIGSAIMGSRVKRFVDEAVTKITQRKNSSN